MKKCQGACKEVKRDNEFYVNNSNRDRLQNTCKKCMKIRNKDYRQKQALDNGCQTCIKCNDAFADDYMVETPKGYLCLKCDNIEMNKMAKKYNAKHPIKEEEFQRKTVSIWDSMMVGIGPAIK